MTREVGASSPAASTARSRAPCRRAFLGVEGAVIECVADRAEQPRRVAVVRRLGDEVRRAGVWRRTGLLSKTDRAGPSRPSGGGGGGGGPRSPIRRASIVGGRRPLVKVTGTMPQRLCRQGPAGPPSGASPQARRAKGGPPGPGGTKKKTRGRGRRGIRNWIFGGERVIFFSRPAVPCWGRPRICFFPARRIALHGRHWSKTAPATRSPFFFFPRLPHPAT